MRTVRLLHLILAAIVLALPGQGATAQTGTAAAVDTLNKVDSEGRKQGWWQVAGPLSDKPEYRAGTLFEEGRYMDSRRTGSWKRYWPNGKLKSEINYVKGMPKGAYSMYYQDGKPQEQGTWDLDRNTGSFKRWYGNGNPMQEFVFDAYGTRDGLQKYYHENGRLEVEVTLAKGREEGVLKRYYANGDLWETAEFHDGEAAKESFRTFKPKGPEAEPPPAESAKPAPLRSTDEMPNTTDFRADGRNTLYDAQHRLSQQGLFRKGRLWEGKLYRYNSNGILFRIEVYANGRYVGRAPLTEDDQ